MDKITMIKELQTSQKQIGMNSYNHANECVNPNLKIDFLSIAREESDIIGWLNYEIDQKDIPPREYPPKEELTKAYNKYAEINN